MGSFRDAMPNKRFSSWLLVLILTFSAAQFSLYEPTDVSQADSAVSIGPTSHSATTKLRRSTLELQPPLVAERAAVVVPRGHFHLESTISDSSSRSTVLRL